MGRRKAATISIVIALVLAVVSIGVAFATFSATLNINGTAEVQASNWNIFFTSTNGGNAAGTSGVSITPTLSNDNSLTVTATGTGTLKTDSFTWDGTFKTPGDRITYTFYIRNAGSYAAKITSINVPDISCTKGGSSETTVCGKITYGIYTNAAGTTRLAANDTLAAGASKQVWVVAVLDKNMTASELPNAPVTVNPDTISITYTQQ